MAKDPLVEGNWSGAGEIAAILAGCWILYASLHRGEESVPRLGAGDRSRRVALRLFALGIIRLAAGMEAGMIVVFTALVWVPLVVASPSVQLHWTGFFISWIVGAAAWVVAESKRPSASEVHPDLAGLPRPTAMDAAAKAPESVPVRPMRDRGQPSH